MPGHGQPLRPQRRVVENPDQLADRPRQRAFTAPDRAVKQQAGAVVAREPACCFGDARRRSGVEPGVVSDGFPFAPLISCPFAFLPPAARPPSLARVLSSFSCRLPARPPSSVPRPVHPEPPLTRPPPPHPFSPCHPPPCPGKCPPGLPTIHLPAAGGHRHLPIRFPAGRLPARPPSSARGSSCAGTGSDPRL